MFETTNKNTPAVTHGRYKSMLIDDDSDGNKCVSINYEEGYLNGEDFVPLGVNHISVMDKPAYTNDEGNEVPAQTGFTDFVTNAAATGFSREGTETFIKARI